MENKLEKIVSLCKRRGFIFPGSEIYGGLANSWDYGPLGVELKNNIQQLWWKFFVQQREDMVGIDAALIMNPKVWEASGHVAGFTDPLVECKKCHNRERVDKLFERNIYNNPGSGFDHFIGNLIRFLTPHIPVSQDHPHQGFINFAFEGPFKFKMADGSETELKNLEIRIDLSTNSVDKDFLIQKIMEQTELKCSNCGSNNWTEPRQFNLLFPVKVGVTESSSVQSYLRGEIAQAMFVNFKNILNSSRVKLPFGIASQGKAFRNEITPGNFIFRTREFDLMEFEYFVKESDWEKIFDMWHKEMYRWIELLGINKEKIHDLEKKDLAHYSKRTVDLEYDFPFGREELYGLAYRTDFDLQNHMDKSKEDLNYTDPDTGKKFVPHVVEPTFGLSRTILVVLCDAYNEDEERIVLKLNPKLAPYKAAVFPLLKNKPELVEKAQGVYKDLKKQFNVAWDERGNIGKRYFSQDEIGTPYCITIDFDTLEDDTVTIRDRDTMQQERIKISELESYIRKSLA